MQNKTITISSIEIQLEGKKFVIKDEFGDKYSFWKNKLDGGETKAYITFPNKIGERTEIGFKEEEKEYKGKKYTARTIMIFKEPTGNAPQAPGINQEPRSYNQPIQPQTPHEEPNLHSHDDLVREINNLKYAIHALWAVLISGDEEKEKSYEMHKIPLVAKSKPEEPEKTPVGENGEINIDDLPF